MMDLTCGHGPVCCTDYNTQYSNSLPRLELHCSMVSGQLVGLGPTVESWFHATGGNGTGNLEWSPMQTMGLGPTDILIPRN